MNKLLECTSESHLGKITGSFNNLVVVWRRHNLSRARPWRKYFPGDHEPPSGHSDSTNKTRIIRKYEQDKDNVLGNDNVLSER